jgi:hypothetical protein
VERHVRGGGEPVLLIDQSGEREGHSLLMMNMKKLNQIYNCLEVEFGNRFGSDFDVRIDYQDLSDYVNNFLPNRSIYVSFIYLWSASDIQGFCEDSALYPSVLYRNGYLPIGQSMSTDLLVVDLKSGGALWFDSTFFINGFGTLINSNREEVDASRDNLGSVGIFVCQFSELFILNVIKGRYASLFALLD